MYAWVKFIVLWGVCRACYAAARWGRRFAKALAGLGIGPPQTVFVHDKLAGVDCVGTERKAPNGNGIPFNIFAPGCRAAGANIAACPHLAWAVWMRDPPTAADLAFFGVRRLHIDGGRGTRVIVAASESRWTAEWDGGGNFPGDSLDGGICCIPTVIDYAAEDRAEWEKLNRD